MKFQRNKKYSAATAYACAIIAFMFVCMFIIANLPFVINTIQRLFNIMSPIIIGFIIAYLICPFLNLCETHIFSKISKIKKNSKLIRVLSILISYIFYATVIVLLLWLVIPQVATSYNDLITKMDTYILSSQEFINDTIKSFKFLNTDRIKSFINDFMGNSYKIVTEITPYITSFLGSFIIQLRDLIIGLVISVYFLYSKETLSARLKKLIYAILPKKGGDIVLEYAKLTNKTFGGFIIGKILDSAIMGILSFIILAILRIPHYQLVSVIIGITNIIPFFGPIIGAVPAAFIIFIAEPKKTIIFIIFIIILQQIDGNIIGPKILGNSIGISSLGVIVAITIMSGLFGLTGMFIGVPLYVLIVSVVRRIVTKLENKRKSQILAGKSDVDNCQDKGENE